MGVKLDAPFDIEGLIINTSWAVQTSPKGSEQVRDIVEVFRGFCGWDKPKSCVSVSALSKLSLYDYHKAEFGKEIETRKAEGVWIPKAGFVKGKSLGLSGYRKYTQENYQTWQPGQEYDFFIGYTLGEDGDSKGRTKIFPVSLPAEETLLTTLRVTTGN